MARQSGASILAPPQMAGMKLKDEPLVLGAELVNHGGVTLMAKEPQDGGGEG